MQLSEEIVAFTKRESRRFMDLRESRTKKNILNAFITLRSKKPIEKITIRELSELANINKTTFYRHYKDIYDLSDYVENAFISDVIQSIPNKNHLLEKGSIQQLVNAFISQGELFNIIFSGSRADTVVHKIHQHILSVIYEEHPEYKHDISKSVMLTALIYGIFHAYSLYKEHGFQEIMNGLEPLNNIFQEL